MLTLFISLFLAISSPQVATLYHSLDPQSVSQQLAFYELYPDTAEGQKALQNAWRLLAGEADAPIDALTPLDTPHELLTLLTYLTDPSANLDSLLSESELQTIEHLGKRLANRHLPGHTVWTVDELVALPVEKTDLARGLLLTLLGDDAEKRSQLRSYEAILDMMALQISASLPSDASPRQKIDAINRFLFVETHLRFPPHSLYAKDIDVYTFLPSVLDSRRGVCLGVSTLYLCLAQRLNLSLEAVTPPGHIYVRYRDEDQLINIETTARGVHVPNREYLTIHTLDLQTRNVKEVIGLNFMNQGAALWHHGQHEKAVEAYETALPFLPDDPLLQEFLGYNLLITGDLDRGRSFLIEARDNPPSHLVGPNNSLEDLLEHKTSIEGIEAIYMSVDETRESILEKQKRIQEVLKEYPNFRAGWFHLAITYLQLGREGEALDTLEKYHQLEESDPLAAYYLAAVCAGRHDFPKAWKYLRSAEKLAALYNYSPRELKELRLALKLRSPE